MTRKTIFGLLLFLSLFANGCWDRQELESLGLVQALGFDLAPDGKGVTITTMIAVPTKLGGGSQPGGGGGGEEAGTFLISMKAPSIYEAFNLMNTTVNREITLVQNSVLIIGEEMARQGVRKWVDNLIRFREMRRTINIFICRGKASDVMKVKPVLEKNPAEYFLDLLSLSNRTGMYPSVTLNDFMNRYEAFAVENYAPILAKYKQKEGAEDQKAVPKGSPSENDSGSENKGQKSQEPQDIRIVGTAIFKKDKMIGSFDLYESQILLLVTNRFREAMLTINDPKKKGNYVVFRLIASAPPRITYRNQSHEDRFNLKLNLEADVISIQSNVDYTRPKMEELLGKHIARELKKRILKVLAKAQNQYNSDVFGFGVRVRNTLMTSTDWDKYNWPDKFKDAKINIQVKVDIRRVGVQFQPPVER